MYPPVDVSVARACFLKATAVRSLDTWKETQWPMVPGQVVFHLVIVCKTDMLFILRLHLRADS